MIMKSQIYEKQMGIYDMSSSPADWHQKAPKVARTPISPHDLSTGNTKKDNEPDEQMI